MPGNALDSARSQLLDLIEVGAGAVELLDEWTGDLGPVLVISLDTSGLTPGPGGISVRDRERFHITIPDSFPFDPPTAFSVHRRWAGTPHVQYGRLLCLYLAPGVEWNPADGMRGFVARLSEWIERAVAGTLDPDDQPLHPPVVYGSAASGKVVVHPNLAPHTPWAADGSGDATATVFAWTTADATRLDVIEWMDRTTVVARAFAEDEPVFGAGGKPFVVLPTVLVPGQFGSEFPRTAKTLSEGLDEHGYSHEQLLWDLSTASLINRNLRRRQIQADPDAAGIPWDAEDKPSPTDPGEIEASADAPDIDDDVPLLTALLIGTPSRRVDASVQLAHLAAWRLDGLSAQIADVYGSARLNDNVGSQTRLAEIARGWFDTAKVTWMRLMEARPEVTNRRDRDTPVHWLVGKRVLVMGCGALGGPIAEYCARAGVSHLTVADSGIVTPGILVRQLFDDTDIGRAKAKALTERLTRIRSDLNVIASVGNVRTTLLTVPEEHDQTTDGGADQPDQREQIEARGQAHPLNDFDLVIDATATASVRSATEHAFKRLTTRPQLVTMVIGHDANRGLVTTNLTNATGASADTFRKVALLGASGAAGWDDVLDDLFPDPPRTDLFFPEPGCSSPTFIGSAAQTAALAGLMLDEAMRVLSQHAPPTSGVKHSRPTPDSRDSTGVPLVSGTVDPPGAPEPASFASAVRLGAAASRGTSRTQWAPDIVQPDPASGFEVRFAASAITEIRSEVRRGDRTRGPEIETGGMLLGAFDDATGVIHVDRVAGPPPDSYLSATYFQHGTDGSQDRVTWETEHSRGLSGFLGFWHTHPGGRAYPSPTDEQGMASIVAPDGARRRALMMILGAAESPWAAWRDNRSAPVPDIYVRVVPRDDPYITTDHARHVPSHDLQRLPSGDFYRGGFAHSVRHAPTVVLSSGAASARLSARSKSREPWWRRKRRHP